MRRRVAGQRVGERMTQRVGLPVPAMVITGTSHEVLYYLVHYPKIKI